MKQYRVRAGADCYGFGVGILLIDCSSPFIPGDVGNASTFDFPVLFETVPGATLERLTGPGDDSLTDDLIRAAKKMERMGVRAITSDCGYMVRYQERVADAVDVPVILSSLVQLPMLETTISAGKRIGIICSVKKYLTPELLEFAGLSDPDGTVIYGLERQPNFRTALVDASGVLDPAKIEHEVVATAVAMVDDHPEIGPILLECSNLPPYAHAVQEATGRMVFDFTTLIDLFYRACMRAPFRGIY
ncbi:MAG: hypothetical protein V7642_3079 [Burkholderiales bacterium]